MKTITNRTGGIIALFLCLALQVHGQTVDLEKGLVAYYPFNGNANDESGNGHNGKSNGATLTKDRHGEDRNAYKFSGDSYIEINKRFSGMRNATLSFWFNGDDQNQPRERVPFIQTASLTVMLQNMPNNHQHHGDKIYAFFHDDRNGNSSKPWSSEKFFTPKFKQGWNHIVVRINNADECFLTMNGEKIKLQSSNRDLPSGVYIDSFIGGVKGGRDILPGARGVMDEIRIYNRTLSDSEVVAIHDLEKKPKDTKSDLEEGLIAFYPFNENANDESGNEYHGTVNGATLVKDRHGESSNAYKFDGNDFIRVKHNSKFNAGTNFALSVWYTIEGPSNNDIGSIISKDGRNSGWWLSTQRSGNTTKHLRWEHYRVGGFSQNKTFKYSADTWYHSVIVYNNRNLYFYLDNELIGERKLNGNSGISSSDLLIGNQFSGISGRGWKGKIDDVRIYNRALNKEEVGKLFELDKPNEPKNIITSQPQSGSFARGSTITIKVGIDDSYDSPFIQWFKNGQPLSGENSSELTLKNANEKSGGNYYALISTGGKAETSESAKIVILSLPEITAISKNTVVDEGETIALSVDADGTPPLSYQWKKVGADSILSTSSNLVLKNVDEDDAGSYVVVVSSEGGEVTSPAVILGIRPDTDDDGLLDHVEVALGTDITKRDTDGDGISDYDEVEIFSTAPTRADTDGDGLNDGLEIRGKFNPRKPTERADGSIAIGVAVELEFFTLTWNRYQLQWSKDLNRWKDLGDSFAGVGGYSSILQPARKTKVYWRLKIIE